MFCTRSQKKILGGTSFFDPAPPATAIGKGRWTRCEVAQPLHPI
jgi:hypothetical protein